ncbi:cell wall protein [Purpureocillium lavendulum]|uniref:Cell wall protein n=1 Tax=Purpureocillium lavendulum TaxID=1247861 RepID=A0AB34FT63_9HYPO|nr:cell wall protein [Purpureocillium lavendulum]
MKFLTLACLATSAVAGVVEPPTRVLERDLATVTGVISGVGEQIDNLDKAAKAFSGDQKPVVAAAEKLIQALKDGKTKVDGSDDLSLADALGLQEPVKALQAKGETLEKDFKEKRSEVEKAGACSTVRSNLADINKNSQALISSVVSKVPKDAQAIAKSLADGLTKVLNQAQDDFSEANCKDSGNGGSSSAPGSTGAGSTSAPGSTASGSASATGSAPATTAVPTGSATTPSQPTGTGAPTKAPTQSGPVVTAGAAVMAPAGALAIAMAAIMV